MYKKYFYPVFICVSEKWDNKNISEKKNPQPYRLQHGYYYA